MPNFFGLAAGSFERRRWVDYMYLGRFERADPNHVISTPQVVFADVGEAVAGALVLVSAAVGANAHKDADAEPWMPFEEDSSVVGVVQRCGA